ncbi:hypothetical protein L1887_42480 [Cichorium endivia]|nr:hypothetical protein L1887_42480 [Cichorium endivia]
MSFGTPISTGQRGRQLARLTPAKGQTCSGRPSATGTSGTAGGLQWSQPKLMRSGAGERKVRAGTHASSAGADEDEADEAVAMLCLTDAPIPHACTHMQGSDEFGRVRCSLLAQLCNPLDALPFSPSDDRKPGSFLAPSAAVPVQSQEENDAESKRAVTSPREGGKGADATRAELKTPLSKVAQQPPSKSVGLTATRRKFPSRWISRAPCVVALVGEGNAQHHGGGSAPLRS